MFEITSLRTTITFDGTWVTITKGIPAGATWRRTTRRINVAEITSVTLVRGSWLTHGYIQFTVAGTPAALPASGGLAAGTPPRTDMNSMTYWRAHNDAMAALAAAVQETVCASR